MPYVTIDIQSDYDVDLDEFLDNCSFTDYEYIIEKIYAETPKIFPEIVDLNYEKLGQLQKEYYNKFNALVNGGHVYKLTSDEEDFLENIFKKYL